MAICFEPVGGGFRLELHNLGRGLRVAGSTATMGSQPGPMEQPEGREVAPGTCVGGRYRIRQHLGAGGMGVILEADDLALDRRVAIKMLKPQHAASVEARRRLSDEARILSLARHPHVLEIFDVAPDANPPFIVMERLHGETLERRLARERRIAPAALAHLIEPIVAAVAHAHRRGIVHRDIKPDNIFLCRDDERVVPKLMDFGVAKRGDTGDARLTGARMILGTPAYMAPEQVLSSRDVDPSADQYALGVVLYECLSGRLPHDRGDGESTMMAKFADHPRDLRTVAPDVDPRIAAVVMRAISRGASDRYPSVEAFGAAFAEAVDASDRGVFDNQTVEAPRRDVMNSTASQSLDAFVRTIRRGPSTALPGIALLIALTALAGTAWNLTKAHSSPTAATAPHTAVRERVVFHVRAAPSNTQILLDGALVGYGHADLERLRNGRRYHLALRASGFAPVDMTVAADSDAYVRRALAPLSNVLGVREQQAAQRR